MSPKTPNSIKSTKTTTQENGNIFNFLFNDNRNFLISFTPFECYCVLCSGPEIFCAKKKFQCIAADRGKIDKHFVWQMENKIFAKTFWTVLGFMLKLEFNKDNQQISERIQIQNESEFQHRKKYLRIECGKSLRNRMLQIHNAIRNRVVSHDIVQNIILILGSYLRVLNLYMNTLIWTFNIQPKRERETMSTIETKQKMEPLRKNQHRMRMMLATHVLVW